MAQEEAFDDEDGECSICFECPFDEPLQTPCRHMFCRDCIVGYLQIKSECPLCRAPTEMADLKQPKKQTLDSPPRALGGNGDDIRFDSKIIMLLAELDRIRRERPNEKSLVFTAFSKSLEWICSELECNGFSYRTLSGNMSLSKRKKQLQQFHDDDDVKVFVLTVRSGAVGVTLTAANHVFMMEPPLNPALYRQAINRVHRLGQKKKVFIHNLIMRDSVEQRIWNINKGKLGESTNESIVDMAGSIGSEKKVNLKQNEIVRLFLDDVDCDENEQQ